MKRPTEPPGPKPSRPDPSPYMLTPEEWGHRMKEADPQQAARHYMLARVIRERLGWVTVH
jgi:hypothetical protein